MSRLRAVSLVVATLLAAACAPSPGAPASLGLAPATPTGVIATFTGVVDPATGRLTVQVDPASDPGALTVFLPAYDGTTGTGAVNTFELATDPSVVPSTVALDCDGTVNAWEGDVAVRSFFRNQALRNVYVEITGMTPGTHTACNSATTPVPGVKTPLSNGFGLWSYGDLVPDGTGTGSVSSTRTWKFRLAASEEFRFEGRIWATLGTPTAISGGPEFDWSATSLVRDPPRSFQEVGTTLAHIVWNGAGFVDAVGGVTFTKLNGTGGTFPTNIADPDQPAATFDDGVYYVETISPPSANASRLPLDHGFTVCAKIKPGASPPSSMKTIFAKANPIVATGVALPRGFALMQMNGEYCFHYRTEDDAWNEGNEVMTYVGPGASPEAWTYDYICGGRAATGGPTDGFLWAGAHGAVDAARVTTQSGFFIGQGGGAALPLAIGATADGFTPAADLGLYEVIVDSRGATPDVMRDIVAAAEGRLLPGAGNGAARQEPQRSSPVAVIGADGASYTLPPYATTAVSTDGSGLLDAGTRLVYTRPLQTHTSATGFCVGAEVQATGAWSAVRGTLLQLDSTSFEIQLDGGADGSGARGFWMFSQSGGGSMFVFDGWGTENGWADGTDHVFKACAGPPGVSNHTALFLDGAPVVNPVYEGADPDFADTTSRLYLGSKSDGGNLLTGARIRRIFICADPDPTHCN